MDMTNQEGSQGLTNPNLLPLHQVKQDGNWSFAPYKEIYKYNVCKSFSCCIFCTDVSIGFQLMK